MKRLPFKTEFVDKAKSGEKRFTSRWKLPNLKVGEIVSATTRMGKTPAFLVKAEDGFATLRITSIESKFWFEFTEDDAKDCGVTRDWYLKEKPNAHDMDRIHKIGFEVLEVKR